VQPVCASDLLNLVQQGCVTTANEQNGSCELEDFELANDLDGVRVTKSQVENDQVRLLAAEPRQELKGFGRPFSDSGSDVLVYSGRLLKVTLMYPC
jgi:hypothetical protein